MYIFLFAPQFVGLSLNDPGKAFVSYVGSPPAESLKRVNWLPLAVQKTRERLTMELKVEHDLNWNTAAAQAWSAVGYLMRRGIFISCD